MIVRPVPRSRTGDPMSITASSEPARSQTRSVPSSAAGDGNRAPVERAHCYGVHPAVVAAQRLAERRTLDPIAAPPNRHARRRSRGPQAGPPLPPIRGRGSRATPRPMTRWRTGPTPAVSNRPRGDGGRPSTERAGRYGVHRHPPDVQTPRPSRGVGANARSGLSPPRKRRAKDREFRT